MTKVREEGREKERSRTRGDMRPVATRYASHVTPKTYSTLLQVGFHVARMSTNVGKSAINEIK